MTPNTVLLRRGKILIRDRENSANPKNQQIVATFNANLSGLGYTLDKDALMALSHLGVDEIATLYNDVIPTLKEFRGLHTFKPMYPNFPKQVIEATDAELYINALLHYFTVWVADITGDKDVIWLPQYKKDARGELSDKVEYRVLSLGKISELKLIATRIATSNTSISPADKADLAYLIENDHFSMPDNIPNKENLAYVTGLLLKKTLGDKDLTAAVIESLKPHFGTATDVLRLSIAMSEGDVSLKDNSKFRTFSRPERRVILSLLENTGLSKVEDMQRFKEKWLRLGEKLHAGEFKTKFPHSFDAFATMRNNTKVMTFNTKVEQAVRNKDVDMAIELLLTRPGEFARRLDHVLRGAGSKWELVMESFASIAPKVSTPVLLQLANHFEHRNKSDLRIVFPKGNTAKVQALKNNLPPMPKEVSAWAASVARGALSERFNAFPPLGKVYVDPDLANYNVPFSMRSASKGLRTLERGSAIPLADSKDTARFFIWWKEKDSRADLDLSALIYDGNWDYKEHIAYTNLRGGRNSQHGYSAAHSGDITEAPNGACEFIDIDMNSMQSWGGRYIVMTVSSYSRQKFADLAECSAGWMLRDEVQSGEIFDPRTILDKIDITCNSTMVMPLVIDTIERKIIWADMSIKPRAGRVNNVLGNYDAITLIGRGFQELKKPNLYDLLVLHAKARGELVLSPKGADNVFSVDSEIQFDHNRIASEFMANELKIPTPAHKKPQKALGVEHEL